MRGVSVAARRVGGAGPSRATLLGSLGGGFIQTPNNTALNRTEAESRRRRRPSPHPTGPGTAQVAEHLRATLLGQFEAQTPSNTALNRTEVGTAGGGNRRNADALPPPNPKPTLRPPKAQEKPPGGLRQIDAPGGGIRTRDGIWSPKPA